MPTEPLYLLGSDQESPTGLSPQLETLSLGSSDSQAASKGWKKSQKQPKKKKGAAKDVWDFFQQGEGKRERRWRWDSEYLQILHVSLENLTYSSVSFTLFLPQYSSST